MKKMQNAPASVSDSSAVCHENAGPYVFAADQLDVLIVAAQRLGYKVLGPVARDGAIVYQEVSHACELPIGWTDEQGAGRYRLVQGKGQTYFGFSVGPHGWKQFLNPPIRKLWQAQKSEQGMTLCEDKAPLSRYAFLGVRSCELHALALQDQIFFGGTTIDSTVKTLRENALVIAVQCGRAGGTCFCASMQTGPRATQGYDLALTEVLDGGGHFFVAETGSAKGAQLLEALSVALASKEQIAMATAVTQHAASSMGRTLETNGLKEALVKNVYHARWAHVASRCLNCANCTMVCPTCFCTTVQDTTDLTGEHAQRWQKWDSCFTLDFSYLHGGSVRKSGLARYRQWLTHKLSTWIDQFGSTGCVGCGRCISWCPVGIDLTEEVLHLRHGEQAKGKEVAYEKTHV